MTAHFNVPTPADVSPVTLNFLLKWSLAAAQECFVLKGIAEKTIKDGMLAKLALATGHMYENARELGEELGIGSIHGKSLAAYLSGRATYYKALAQVKKASECLAANRYGEEISRLNEASHLLNRCKDHKKLMDPATLGLLDVVAGQIVKNLDRAIKDNSIIYHETVPAVTGLPDIGQAVVARATTMPDWSKNPAVPSRPILFRLVPEAIRVRAAEYYDKRNARVADIASRLKGLKEIEQAIMKECNLPSLLEVSQTSMGLPSSILDKSQFVRSNGGSESLQSSLETVEALKGDAKQLLKQVENLLKDEQMNDTQARQEFGSKWTRPESEILNEQLQQALDSYKKNFVISNENDLRLQKELDEAIVGISALDSSQTDLEASIPASTSHNSQRGDVSLANALRTKLALINGFEGRRVNLFESIDRFCHHDGIEATFTALGEEVLKDDHLADSIISDRLNSDEFVRFLNELDSIECEQQIELGELRKLAISFAASLTLRSALEERKNALQTLESAYISFTNLTSHFQNAISHYSDFLDLLEKLRENTRDFTVSRGIELEEVKETLQRSSMMGGAMKNSGSAGVMAREYNSREYNSREYNNGDFDYGADYDSYGANGDNYRGYDDNYVKQLVNERPRMSGPSAYEYGNGYGHDANYMMTPPIQNQNNNFPGRLSNNMSPQYNSNPQIRGPPPSQPHHHHYHNNPQQWAPGMPVQYAQASPSNYGPSPQNPRMGPQYPGNPNNNHNPNNNNNNPSNNNNPNLNPNNDYFYSNPYS